MAYHPVPSGRTSAQSLIEEMLARRPELLGRQNHGTPSASRCYFILPQFVETPPDDLDALASIRQYMLRNRSQLLGACERISV